MQALTNPLEGSLNTNIPLVVENVTELNFGKLTPNLARPSGVRVNHDGSLDCGVEMSCVPNRHTAAVFKVSGSSDRFYSIALPPSIIVANQRGAKMKVVEFAGSKKSGTLSSGQDEFSVGGYLNVAPNQDDGLYQGSFVVTVEYQ